MAVGRARTGRARLLSVGLAAAWLVAGCASAGGPAADVAPELGQGPACAQIFSTNDTHGYILPAVHPWSEGRLVGGSAAMAGYVAEARRSDPACPVFVVSGGDMMQGTLVSNLSDGASTIELLNRIGYDAAAIGNHEYDWTIGVLEERIRQADFAMLGANTYLAGTRRHPEWTAPWTIVEKDGVRVGFIGLTTISTPTVTRPSNVTSLDFGPISEALDRYIPEVRAAGVDFVVVVMHAGAFCDQDSGACEGEAIDELAATTEPYDYAVTGHTHSLIETEVNGVPVVQSFSYGTAFGLGRLERDESGTVRAELLGVRQTYVDETEPDPEIARIAEAYRAEIVDLVERVVMELEEPLPKPRRGDHALGRLIADAQRARTGAQVSIMNNGGIRVPLPAGRITYAQLFELQPFGNALVRLELSGRDLLAALEHALEANGTDAQVSGITVIYDPEAAEGGRIREVRLSDGQPVEPDGRYLVTVNDFMATGGGGYTMFERAYTTDHTGIVDLDALVEHLESLPQPVVAPTEPRWIPTTGR